MKSTKFLYLALMTKFIFLIKELMCLLSVLKINDYNLQTYMKIYFSFRSNQDRFFVKL